MVGKKIKSVTPGRGVPAKFFPGILIHRESQTEILDMLDPESGIQIIGIPQIPAAGSSAKGVNSLEALSFLPYSSMANHQVGILFRQNPFRKGTAEKLPLFFQAYK